MKTFLRRLREVHMKESREAWAQSSPRIKARLEPEPPRRHMNAIHIGDFHDRSLQVLIPELEEPK